MNRPEKMLLFFALIDLIVAAAGWYVTCQLFDAPAWAGFAVGWLTFWVLTAEDRIRAGQR